MTQQRTDYSGLSLRAFSDALASDAPTPGGGSAAAIAANLAASLVCMVTRLSQDRPRYAAFAATHTRVLGVAEQARQRFLELADADSAAYSALVRARSAARASAAEHPDRAPHEDRDDDVIQAAHEAARVPMLIVRECYALIDQVDRLAGRSNLNAASDLDIAARLLEAAARGAGANVIVNLPAIGDERLADSMLGELEVRLHEMVSAVARIASQVRTQGLRAPESA
jgi:formiminotetrahydrofolate cyclodeaminase